MNGWASYTLKDLDDAEERANVCGIEASAVRKDVKAIVLDEDLSEAKRKAEKKYAEGNWPLFYFTGNGDGGLRKKTYLKDMEGRTSTNLWQYEEVGHNDEAKKEVSKLFGGHSPFDTPKPVRLMKRLLKIASDENSIVVDFFSGSATMGQAVLEANVEDNGSRKFILVQLQEESKYPGYETLCDVGEDRIKRYAQTLEKNSTNKNIDLGFRCYRVDSTNMKDVYYNPSEYNQGQMEMFLNNIKADRTPEDILIQVMLDLGILLSSKIEETTIAGKKVFSVADGYLIACFDDVVTDDVVKAIAEKHPFYAVFRDSGMASDSVAANFEQIFETYSPNTIRKVL